MAITSSPMSRAGIPDLLELGIREAIFSKMALRDNQREQIYNTKSSRKKTESIVNMSGFGQYQRKDEGVAPTFDTGQEAWKTSFTHDTWALGMELTEEGMEDDLYDFYTALGGSLGDAASYTQQVQAADIFNDNSLTVYTVGATNYPLLSTSHYLVGGAGTWSNRPATAGALNLENLENALIAWRTNMVDQRGRKVASSPTKLVVSPADELMACKLLQSIGIPFSNNNEPNAIRVRRTLQLVVWDFLSTSGQWFLLGPNHSLVIFTRRAHRVRSREDNRTGNSLMIGSYRESHGAPNVTEIYGSP